MNRKQITTHVCSRSAPWSSHGMPVYSTIDTSCLDWKVKVGLSRPEKSQTTAASLNGTKHRFPTRMWSKPAFRSGEFFQAYLACRQSTLGSRSKFSYQRAAWERPDPPTTRHALTPDSSLLPAGRSSCLPGTSEDSRGSQKIPARFCRTLGPGQFCLKP